MALLGVASRRDDDQADAVKRVLVLGSTGSIGVQALEVIASSRRPHAWSGLSCGSRVGLLMEQATSLGVTDVAVADPAAADGLSTALYPELRVRAGARRGRPPGAGGRRRPGAERHRRLRRARGHGGHVGSWAAPLALANKESLVSGGRVVTDLAARSGAPILPVDSEHSALFQLLAGEERRAVRSLIADRFRRSVPRPHRRRSGRRRPRRMPSRIPPGPWEPRSPSILRLS